MPSSNPLPPKENALFKRILVSINVNIGRKMAKRRKGPSYSSEVILPKKFIPEVELNYIQTVAARLQATLDFLKNRVV